MLTIEIKKSAKEYAWTMVNDTDTFHCGYHYPHGKPAYKTLTWSGSRQYHLWGQYYGWYPPESYRSLAEILDRKERLLQGC